MSGCKLKEDLFLFAAQFGYGMVCWGMVLGPDMQLSESNDALAKMSWRPGASGLGGGNAVTILLSEAPAEAAPSRRNVP